MSCFVRKDTMFILCIQYSKAFLRLIEFGSSKNTRHQQLIFLDNLSLQLWQKIWRHVPVNDNTKPGDKKSRLLVIIKTILSLIIFGSNCCKIVVIFNKPFPSIQQSWGRVTLLMGRRDKLAMVSGSPGSPGSSLARDIMWINHQHIRTSLTSGGQKKLALKR